MKSEYDFKYVFNFPTRDKKRVFSICTDSKLMFWTKEQVDNDPFKHYYYIQSLRVDFLGYGRYNQWSMLESTTDHMFTIEDDIKEAKLYVKYPYEHKPAIIQLVWWTDTYSGLCDEHAVENISLVEFVPHNVFVESKDYYKDVLIDD